MDKKEKKKIDGHFLKEAAEDYVKLEKTGTLRTLISLSVKGKRATPQTDAMTI